MAKAGTAKSATKAKADQKSGDWIGGAVSKRPGQLHRDLDVPAGKPIPASTLNEAARQPGKVGQRARLAKTLKRLNK